jgi:hypothetical protein
MSASHQTQQLDLRGLVLTDNQLPSKQRIYPIFGGERHSPDYDWVTGYPKCLLWHQAKQIDAILDGTIKLPTKSAIESGLLTDAKLHAREFLNKKFNASFELHYQKNVQRAQEKPSIPYLDTDQTKVPEAIYRRLTTEDKQFFEISTVDEIDDDHENCGLIDIFEVGNKWQRKVVYDWKKLNKGQLTYKLPADKNVHEDDFEHLSEDELMKIISTQGNLQMELNTSMQSCNDIILNQLKAVRPVMLNCVKLFENIVKETDLHHSTATIQLVNNFEYAEAWSTFVQNRTDSIRKHPDCLHMINLHYVELTWNDKTNCSFSEFWNEIKSRQSQLWLLTQTLQPEKYDTMVLLEDVDSEENSGKLVPLTLNQMLVALDVMTDEEFGALHPNRLNHFPEHERLTTLMFKLRHFSSRWREICRIYETKYPDANRRRMKNFHDFLSDHFTTNAEDHKRLNCSSKKREQEPDHSLEEYARGQNTAHIASQEKSEQVAEPCRLCTYWLQACKDRNLLSDTNLIPGKSKPQPGYHTTETCKFRHVERPFDHVDHHCHPRPLEDILKPIEFHRHNQLWKKITKQDLDRKLDNYNMSVKSDKSDKSAYKRSRQDSSGNSQSSDSRPHKSNSNYIPRDYPIDKSGNRSNQGGDRSGGGDRNSRGGNSGSKGSNSRRDTDRTTYAAAANSGNRTNYQQNPRSDNRDQNRRDQPGGYNSRNYQRRDDSENQAHNAHRSQSFDDRDDYRNNQHPDHNSENDLS